MSAGGAGSSGGFRLPPFVSETLVNGVSVHVMEYHELPLVELQVFVRAGGADDPTGKEGLANLVADLLRKGTATRSASEIADAVDFVGGSLSASADQDGTRITAEFLAKDADLALDLVAETLMKPSFAQAEVERLRTETVSELKAIRENPSALAARRFVEILYKGHPYGHPTSGWETTVATITRDDVVAFYRGHYVPGKTIVVAVGDFGSADMMARIKSRLSAWSGTAPAVRSLPEPASPTGRRIVLVDKPDATQSQIRIGGLGIRRTDPDFAAFMVANTVLGSGFTSRLSEEVRVNRGLSYSVGSRFFPLVQRGPFLIQAGTKNESTLEAAKVALDVYETLRRDGPTADEVDKARRYLKGTFAIAHQSPDALAEALGEIAFYGLPRDHYDTWLDRIAKVSVEDVRRALSRFPSESSLVLVLGQAQAVRKDLETLGPIDMVPLVER